MECTGSILRFWVTVILTVTADGFTCSTVSRVYKRINDAVKFQFNVSQYLPQQSGEVSSFNLAFYNGTPLTIINYFYDADSIIEVLPGFIATADTNGRITITLSTVTQARKGTYILRRANGISLDCTCLYILGVPNKPTVSVSSNPSVGGFATLTCTSTSTTSPSNHSLSFVYSWVVGNTENPDDKRYSYIGNTLKLSNIIKEDASKQFKCFVREDVTGGYTSTFSDTKSLDIRFPPDGPPVINGYTDGGEYLVIDGKQGQLTCTVSGGNPAPTLSWNCINNGSTTQSSNSGTIRKTFTWTAVRGQDRTCTCTASHYSGSKTVSIRVKVLYPPTQPTFMIGTSAVSSLVKVIQSYQLSVTCISEGQPEPQYTWKYPDGQTITGQNLTVNNIQNSGRYTCEVMNTLTSLDGVQRKSSFIDVEILSPPTSPTFKYGDINGVDIPTRSLDVIRDDTFLIACVSSGNPNPSYHWNTSPVVYSRVITVSSIQADMSSKCTAENRMTETVGQSLTRSATALVRMNVQYPPTNVKLKYHYGQNSVIDILTELKIIKGRPFNVTCSSDGKPPPNHRWTGIINSSSANLEVSSANKDHSGLATCIAENTMTRTFANPVKTITGTKKDSFSINILFPPVIGDLTNSSAVEGSTFSISCPVTIGNPSRTEFEWTKNGIVWKSTQDFTIYKTSRADAMFYTCKVSNSMFQTGEQQPISLPDTESFYLNIWYNSTVESFYIIGHETKTTVTLNEAVPLSFICTADSNPGSTLFVTKEEIERHTETNTKSLTYDRGSAKCTDRGTYRCEGFNQYNKINSYKSVQLYVNCKPRPSPFVTLEENVTSALNIPAVLSFTTLAYPEPAGSDYKWYRGNLLLSGREGFQIHTEGLQTNLTINVVNKPNFGEYKVVVENAFGSYEQRFYLSPQDKPDAPTGFKTITELTNTTSFTATWTPGSNNGLPQTFILLYKKTSDTEWNSKEIPDLGKQTVMYHVVKLMSGTAYDVKLYASNVLGNSSETDTLTVTTHSENKPPPVSGALIGGIAGGASAVIIVPLIGVVILWRRGFFTKGKSQSSNEGSDRKPVIKNKGKDDENDYDMQDNPMYESAGPRPAPQVIAFPDSGTVYSEVKKTKPGASVPGNDTYAEVNKTTKRKQENSKSKKGFLKDKKGKKQPLEVDIYENATLAETKLAQGNRKVNDEAIYENPGPSEKAQPKRNVNEDGLIYADLAFNEPPKGQKKLVIHGLDDMTEYVEVDFTKKADPLPESDEEDTKAKK